MFAYPKVLRKAPDTLEQVNSKFWIKHSLWLDKTPMLGFLKLGSEYGLMPISRLEISRLDPVTSLERPKSAFKEPNGYQICTCDIVAHTN